MLGSTIRIRAKSGEAPRRPLSMAPQTALEGTLLNGTYRLDQLIGWGAAGAVYRATHMELGETFAVKVVGRSTCDLQARRLIREARTACAIEHEHIVEVYDLGQTEEGQMFIVMELLEGCDLWQLQEQGNDEESPPQPLEDAETRDIVSQLLDGLSAAHDAGVVHRDIKPENVFVSERDGRRVVKLVDFGLSKLLEAQDPELTAPGTIVGTPIYMSPEHTRSSGLIDARSDIYSTGVLMYELLSGRPPFEATRFFEVVFKHMKETPQDLGDLRPDLPREVVRVVHRALAKDPDERFQSAREMRAAWQQAWSQSSGRPEEDAPAAARPRRPRPRMSTLLAALLHV